MKWGRALAVIGLVPVVAMGCAVDEALPAPRCTDGGSALIAAQSVPTASQIPCLAPLPDGWLVASVGIDQDGTVVRLDSDRAGDDAATLRLEAECDISNAVSAVTEFPTVARYDRIDRLEPGFRASRFYVFPGGCVWWSFDFDNDASATESVAIGETLELISRDEFNDSLRETFIDEDI
jgi:hypothetical protein